MQEIELVLGLLVAVGALFYLANRYQVPYPILLVLGGLALGFVPGIPEVELSPDLVFLLFLPPLLYVAAFFTSLRDFVASLRPILLLAIGLVLFTTCAVAIVARLVVPGLPWPAAFVLGAIVSPPDAIAATAIAQRLGVPRRVVTVIEGESLVNDATGLVAYRLAVAAVVSGVFSVSDAALSFVGVSLGGIAIGLVAGWLAVQIRRRLEDPPIEILVALLTPFAAYLPAERLHVSGVLAAVSAGLYVGWHGPRIMSAAARLQGLAVWSMMLFVLNGLVFMLIGLQLPRIIAELDEPFDELALQAVAISLVVILVRIIWVFPSAYLPRLLVPAIRRRDPMPPWRSVVVISWAGMRGVVSLAAALALPLTIESGEPFPRRGLIVFLTFSVILATLVVQGLSLPALIRWLGVREDGLTEREEVVARRGAVDAALKRIDDLAREPWAPEDLVGRLRSFYQARSRHLDRPDDDGEKDARNAV